ncbi:MAG: AAA family ATPase, partial [Myxococcales bacterium]|nr:AAA family ATPase [Myxococcales bacterium]
SSTTGPSLRFPALLVLGAAAEADRQQGLLEELPSDLRAELAPMLGEAGPALRALELARLFRAVQRLLTWLTDAGPLVLTLEDLHWADEMSLRLLCFACRCRKGRASCFVLGTARTEDVARAPFLTSAIQELESNRILTRVNVCPLSEADTAVLAGHAAEPLGLQKLAHGALAQIWSLSEGNPLVVIECVRALAQGDARADLEASASCMPVPERVRALISRRTGCVGPVAREVLSLAAVIGRELDPVLLGCCALDDATLSAALEELVAAHLIAARGERIYFTHDRIREALYAELLPVRRRFLHGRIAAAMERHCEGRLEPVLGHIGYHYSKAGIAERAIHYLLRFADHAWRRHGLGEALAALEQARADNALLRPAQQAEVALKIAIGQAPCLVLVGRFRDLVERLQAEEPQLEARACPSLAASLHFWLGAGLTFQGQPVAGEEHTERALSEAALCGETRVGASARALLSQIYATTGRYEQGVREAQTAIESFERTADEPDMLTFSYVSLALNHVLMGEWRRALSAARRVEALGDALDSDRIRSIGAARVGFVHAMVQQWEQAMAATERSLALCKEPITWMHALLFRAHVQIGGGQVEEGVTLLEELLSQLEQHGLHAFAAYSRVDHARGVMRLGEHERAYRLAEEAVGFARTVDDSTALARGLCVHGGAALVLGQLPAARASLERALRMHSTYGARIDLADTLVSLGELAQVEGDTAAARRHWMRARDLFAECSIVRGRQRVDGLLSS